LVCHEIDGKGIGPLAERLNLKPSDLSSEQYQMKKVKDLATIVAGYKRKKGSNMPSWGKVLPKTDLYDIAAYISKLTQEDLRFRGDTRRGRALFKGACVACHGQLGTGKGILAQLINLHIIDFTHSGKMKKISDEVLINTIREGKGAFMPSWKDTFGEKEIIDVASYVRTLAR